MAYYRDFREYLQVLDKAGKLRRISDPVDKDRELHPLVRWQYRGINQDERCGFLFDGSPSVASGRPHQAAGKSQRRDG